MNRTLHAASVLACASILGCGGKKDPSSHDVSGAPAPASAPPLALAPFSAAEVEDAKARCALPEGDVDMPPSADATAQRVVGGWYRCSGGFGFGPGGSVQLARDGTFAELVDDANGGLYAAHGYDETGKWLVSDDEGGGGPWYVIFECGACTGDSNTQPVFERSPARIRSHTSGDPSWLVPLTHLGP